jgi:SAM-dependent methyltransferase
VRQVDHSDPLPYYYAPLTAWLYRERLRMALDLLGPGPFDRLLEAGYGSGILLPALRDRARALCAMDLHRQASVVQQMLATERTDADLAIGNVCRLGYVGGSFDALVCVSTLEHLHGEELDQAVREFRRVLRPGGVAVVGVPASGWAMDLLFRAIGFSEIGEHHVSTHGNVEEALRRHFAIDAERRLPGFAPRRVALYTVFRGRT